ncbi:hypothetical protein [Burkholderia territorii]|nr:hypothetical protein [Burkholderia territorii]
MGLAQRSEQLVEMPGIHREIIDALIGTRIRWMNIEAEPDHLLLVEHRDP